MTAEKTSGNLTDCASWLALPANRAHVGKTPLLTLFYRDPERPAGFTVQAAGLYFDSSRQPVDTETMGLPWDCVGGRDSMDSAVGLATMVAIGPERFSEMRAGVRAMDEHFCTAPAERNLPLLMGLLAIWNNNSLGAESVAVLPYSAYLKRLPAYLQQLTMESNGKRVTAEGTAVECDTNPIHWGEPGTNGQHSFYQMLHPGTRLIPCDFIGFIHPLNPLGRQHDLLMANLIAQGETLAFGKTAVHLRLEDTPEDLAPHRLCPGDRPGTTILAGQLTPSTLGTLVALYEHSVFTQGVIWGIELGKQLASKVVDEITSDNRPDSPHDVSTSALIRHYRSLRRVPK
jgi:glucose-6-phosphate isomerase